MSNLASPTVITQSLSTIPEAPKPASEAATEATNGAAPPATSKESVAASGAGEPDKNLELSRRFGAVAQKEARARRLETEAQTRATKLAEREKELDAKLAELDEALSDPVGHMLKNGKDPVEVAKRYATPETEEEKRIRKLEERDAAREAEATKAKEAEEAKRKADARFEALKGFVKAITSAECPNLTTLYQAREVPALVDELLNRPSDPRDPDSVSMITKFRADLGRNPTDKEIRETLEYEAELRATKIIERHRGAAAPGSQVAQPPPGAPTQDSSKNESGPSGISNQHAAARSSGAKKPASLQERRKKAKEELTVALEAEANDE